MQSQIEIQKAIRQLATGKFDSLQTDEFVNKFTQLTDGETIIDYFLQISTDQGRELEIGFFTTTWVTDVTLSNGKIYSCSYLISKVTGLEIKDHLSKWTLTIYGEKKFDYNILKPNPFNNLKRYSDNLRTYSIDRNI